MATPGRNNNRPRKRVKVCPVIGCRRSHDRLSSYCRLHAGRIERAGSPTAVLVTATDLLPYRKPMRDLLAVHASNTAVVAATALVDDLMRTHGFTEDRACAGRRIRPVLDELLARGLTAEQVITELAALVAFWEVNESKAEPAEIDLALAHRSLQLKRSGTNIRNLGRRHLVAFGYRLRVGGVYGFLISFVRHWREREDRALELRRAATSFNPNAVPGGIA